MALRAFVRRRLKGADQRKAVELIKAGGVYVNRLRVRVPGVRLAKGERVTIFPSATSVEPLAWEDLRFVHREDAFCVIDKPPGLPTEPTPETCLGTITDAMVRKLEADGVMRPYVGVVCGLPAAASGLVLLTTRGLQGQNLASSLANQPIKQTFRLQVSDDGVQASRVDHALVKERSGWRVAKPDEDSIDASTQFDAVASGDGTCLIEATLDGTAGDQVVLHASHAGYRVLGGADTELRLCRTAIAFSHPVSGESLSFTRPPPTWPAL
jgi:23S rRNA pseudouridine1911/1915/1917 synthase